jgi:hypothetical protein
VEAASQKQEDKAKTMTTFTHYISGVEEAEQALCAAHLVKKGVLPKGSSIKDSEDWSLQLPNGCDDCPAKDDCPLPIQVENKEAEVFWIFDEDELPMNRLARTVAACLFGVFPEYPFGVCKYCPAKPVCDSVRKGIEFARAQTGELKIRAEREAK